MQNFARIAAAAACLLAAVAHGEEIYKWVDKDGKTHYSSRKEDAAGAATRTVRPAPPPAIGSGPPPAASAANEGLLRRSGDAAPAATVAKPPGFPPSAVAPNYAAENDAAKCQLARDILSGQATHRSGAPIDAYDRQTAESDVRTFCGK